jgi:crossover junction endonuclease MUS81
MILLIDYREKAFIDEITKNKEISEHDNNQNIFCLNIDKDIELYYKITNLDIGDFIICDYKNESNGNNENNESKTIDIKYIYENLILLIERKTFNDLSSSIIDGRFREQKTRIEKTINDNDKIMYIIEGIRKTNTNYGIKSNILEGAILNLIFNHKFKVLNTNNINDTCDTILTIYKKFKKQEYSNKDTNNNCNFSNLKKSERILNNVFKLQLSIIPGVSNNIAQKICDKYNCMIDLINAYNSQQQNEQNKEKLLADIQITDKRKLGKALSKKIYNAMSKNE